MSMPASACLRTRSATERLRISSYACWASAEGEPFPVLSAATASSSSAGRGRLPTCVVKIRLVLRCMEPTVLPSVRMRRLQTVCHPDSAGTSGVDHNFRVPCLLYGHNDGGRFVVG